MIKKVNKSQGCIQFRFLNKVMWICRGKELQPFPSLYFLFLYFFICKPTINSLPSLSLTTLPSSYLPLLLTFPAPSVVPYISLSLSTFLLPSLPFPSLPIPFPTYPLPFLPPPYLSLFPILPFFPLHVFLLFPSSESLLSVPPPRSLISR